MSELQLWSACEEGDLQAAENAVLSGAKNFSAALHYACKGNQLAMAEWCVQHGAGNFDSALLCASNSDNLGLAKWCMEKGAGADSLGYVFRDAISRSNIEIAKWVTEEMGVEVDYDDALVVAAEAGQWDAALWCMENGATDPDGEAAEAAGNSALARKIRDRQQGSRT